MEKQGRSFILQQNLHFWCNYVSLERTRTSEYLGECCSAWMIFNNGITRVCDKFSHNALTDSDWIVNVEDLQIINGGQTCKTIQETIQSHFDKSFDEGFVLVRLYELAGDQHDELLHDITIATNSQNPVDLRDLRANEEMQKNLEIAIEQLGYRYIRKREEANSSIDAIPSTVAAEAIYSTWKERPHVTKFRKNELFGRFYNEVFAHVNGAQLVMAVLIYRYCDRLRKQQNIVKQYPHLPYSTYFMAMLIGKSLLSEMNKSYNELTHITFFEVKQYFETHREQLFQKNNVRLINALNQLYPLGYEQIELRRLSATFRREDLLVELNKIEE